MGPGLQRERHANRFEEFVIARYAITEGRDDEVSHEHDKVSFVMQADALVYPRTMMVVLQDAAITNLTMVRPFRPQFITFRTPRELSGCHPR